MDKLTPFPRSHEEEAINTDFGIVKCTRCGWCNYEEKGIHHDDGEPNHGEGCPEFPDCGRMCPDCGCWVEYIGNAAWDFYDPFWREDCPF
ncbi:protein of unknown function [Pseudodesulfovibrio profundus]|uniref:Uncharacterized protein n=1 Tax=Pseudodesulfovibrio profundus TaxID=57320 RepID=A0A2C8FD79_9BACT|nr:hypothetical protein [Pseudodesulfovibrio profundus]SOB60602.1 protein of unknown function [Pseudodesulfovibrio profundus]